MKHLQFPLLIGADAQYNSRTKNLGVSLPFPIYRVAGCSLQQKRFLETKQFSNSCHGVLTHYYGWILGRPFNFITWPACFHNVSFLKRSALTNV